METSTRIDISRSALLNNIKFIRDLLGKDVALSSVVKGNAYGHGIESIVPIIESTGVNHFSVFNAEEALRVSHVIQPESAIMIMGMLTDDQLAWAIEKGTEFFVFDKRRLEKTVELADKLKKPARVHLDIETGMNRTGFPMRDLNKVLEYIKQHKNLELTGACTHFAGAENISNYYRIKKQIANYKKALGRITSAGFSDFTRHAACSAAAIKYPGTRYDMARIGIMQYGFFPSSEVMIQYMMKQKAYTSPLRQVISWKSQVMGVKHVRQGEFIGYGTTYFANTHMKIATIPIGYSYGFNRSLSNQGRVLIRNRYASVVGLVNMSMLSVDVSDIPEVEAGDEVVIIGTQGDQEITVSSFSDSSNQVNYEMLTRLPSDIPRYVVD